MRALRQKLYALWFALVGSALVTGFLLYQFYAQSSAVQLARTQANVEGACRSIQERYAFFTAGWRGPGATGIDETLRRDLVSVTTAALLRSDGVEGGIWSAEAGSLAYAFPTYEGTGPKTDLPPAEEASIRQINADAVLSDTPSQALRPGASQTLVLQACPLPGPILGLSAWTMERVFTGRGPAYNQLLLGLGLLALTVLAAALFLGHILLGYVRRLTGLEQALALHESDGTLPLLPPTGERELDRLVSALNAAGARLGEARRRVLSTERLATIGRVAAGVAHEIRNPLAAMRLKAENALAARDPARAEPALRTVIEQVDRLDRLLGDLLAVTHPRPPVLVPVRIAELGAGVVAQAGAGVARAGLRLSVGTTLPADATALLDAEQIGRALSILVAGAVAACAGRTGAEVRVETMVGDGLDRPRLRIRVSDDGAEIPPGETARAFEPFEGYREGAGSLGLAIVREIARAHGGEVGLIESEGMTVFEMDLPWRRS